MFNPANEVEYWNDLQLTLKMPVDPEDEIHEQWQQINDLVKEAFRGANLSGVVEPGAEMIPFGKSYLTVFRKLFECGVTIEQLRQLPHFAQDAQTFNDVVTDICGKGDIKMLEYLMGQGLTIEDITGHYQGALTAAAENSQIEVFRFLRTRDLKLKDITDGADDCNFLMEAVVVNSLEILLLLREWGLTIDNLRNSNGHETIFEVAAENNCLEALRLFRQWGMTMEDVMDEAAPDHCLHSAVSNGNVEMLELFRNWNVTPDENGVMGATLEDIHNGLPAIAAHKGHLNVLKYFKEWGVTKEVIQANDHEAIKEAHAGGHHDIVKFLENW